MHDKVWIVELYQGALFNLFQGEGFGLSVIILPPVECDAKISSGLCKCLLFMGISLCVGQVRVTKVVYSRVRL
jgi:hypothetical protein